MSSPQVSVKSPEAVAQRDVLRRSILRFVADQMVVTFDQLERFLGVDRDDALDLMSDMEGERWVERKELSGDGVEWIWLREAGLRETGSNRWSKRVSSLRKRSAVTEVRLLLEEEIGGEWTSDRVLRARYGRSSRPPAGVLEVNGETRGIAIFHGTHDSNDMEEALIPYCERYDAVECFCGTRKARRTAELVKRRTGNAKLIVRGLAQDLKACKPRRRRVNKPQADANQQSMLRLISEQGCLREDQLGRFFGLEGRKVVPVVNALEKARWVKRVEVLAGQPPWLWLREAGIQQAGTGFAYLKPSVWRLEHKYAVNEVRLEFAREAPDGRWVCERQLRREFGGSGGWSEHLPDALFEVDGERYAIEVELTPKTRWQLREVLAHRSAFYDAVLYFCSKRVKLVVEELQRELQVPNLIIRDAYRLPAKPELRAAKRFDPLPEDIGTLALLAEQGGIPLDQLARFLSRSTEDVETIVEGLTKRDFVRCTEFLATEPAWVWLRRRGARFSGTGLEALQPRVGSLEKLRAANEARLLLAPADFDSKVTWVSRRMLEKGARFQRDMPKAVVEYEDGRCAVGLALSRMSREWWSTRVGIWSKDYDFVVFLCKQGVWRDVERLAGEWNWANVVVRELPGIPFVAH